MSESELFAEFVEDVKRYKKLGKMTLNETILHVVESQTDMDRFEREKMREKLREHFGGVESDQTVLDFRSR